VLDNASSNDTAVHDIIKELNLGLSHDENYIRLRCLGHIINLSATENLFGKNSSEFLESITSLEANNARDKLQENGCQKELLRSFKILFH
jgi:hypothetical protein